MKYGTEGGISSTRGLAIAESSGDRPLVGATMGVDIAAGPCPTHLRAVAGSAGLVPVDGEVGVEKDGFAQLFFRG